MTERTQHGAPAERDGRGGASGDPPSPFPLRTWGSADTPVARAGQWLAGTRAGSRLIRAMVPLDRKVLVRSGGRYTALGPFGSPLLLLTTTGTRSGQARTTPLVYLPHHGHILVVGSNFGQQRHPAWSTNLLADPRAVVTIGGRAIAVRARLLAGDERRLAWEQFLAAARPYRSYGDRTDRTFRVFALERDQRGDLWPPGRGT